MQKKVKIIATIGPKSFNDEILSKLKARGVDFFRINLSHTDEEEIEEKVKFISKHGVPIILDTEGNQIRSGNKKDIEFKEGSEVILHGEECECNSTNLFFNPPEIIGNFREGDLISMGFNHSLIRVVDISSLESKNQIRCRVILGGILGGRKAVHVHSDTFLMPPFSQKDFRAMEIAKKHGIKHFTLSFMENAESVRQFRSLYPSSVLYSKIESKRGLDNFIEIAEESDGILIDRGDLSNQVPIERIPLIQKFITSKVRKMGKEIFIATNTLEDMSASLKPNRSEVNDIITTILDGATGFALTKEIAVGNYPIETVNMLNVLISQLNFVNSKSDAKTLIERIEKSNYLKSPQVPSLLIEPHGGVLVNRISKKRYNESSLPEKKIFIDEETLMDAEQIATGAFSPLIGFMRQNDFNSVVERMRLANGTAWPLPIVLRVDKKTRDSLKAGDEISLAYEKDKNVYVLMKIADIYQPDKNKAALKIFGTIDKNHPGVKKFLDAPDFFIGGEIILIKRRISPYKVYELTPSQTRKIFSDRGWSKVIGFHTRNVIHRAHEFVQLEGLKRGMCDGLFVNPVIGKKKLGDFVADAIIKSYEKMTDLKFYPHSKVVFSSLATFSRYAGPREAIFTALVRKNFGCSHFIVGRDHTGVGSYYHPKASHEIFSKFSERDLGIIPIMFDKVFYSKIKGDYVHELDFPNHPEEMKLDISGTEARKMLKEGKSPPGWFIRPEISAMLVEKLKRGEKLFEEEKSPLQKIQIIPQKIQVNKPQTSKPQINQKVNSNQSKVQVNNQNNKVNQLTQTKPHQMNQANQVNHNKPINQKSQKQAKVLWFTGLSGSGKSTIANILIERFKKENKKYLVLDGDDVRARFNKHLGFTPEDIKENNRFILQLCKENSNKYDYILVPVISPFRESRNNARSAFGRNFIEIFMNCPYGECKKRDIKGLYAKAEKGEIKNFIGLHVPYEPPQNPEIAVRTVSEAPEVSAKKILDFLDRINNFNKISPSNNQPKNIR